MPRDNDKDKAGGINGGICTGTGTGTGTAAAREGKGDLDEGGVEGINMILFDSFRSR